MLFIMLMPLQTLFMTVGFAASDYTATFFEIASKVVILSMVLVFECKDIEKQRKDILIILQTMLVFGRDVLAYVEGVESDDSASPTVRRVVVPYQLQNMQGRPVQRNVRRLRNGSANSN